MADSSTQSDFTNTELDQLQRLRASVLAFQNAIGSLPADEQSDVHNSHFNQLRLEAKSLLKTPGFDKKVAQAMTDALLDERAQRVLVPRLSVIVIFGVILALLGLGINSIILEDVLINSLGCLISSSGMLLVIGAFSVLGMTNLRKRRRLSNLGEVYQQCAALLYEINHALNMAIPDLDERPAVEIPEIPSVVDMVLASLDKQATFWQEQLRSLEEERLELGQDTPMELTINIDFVRRELTRVRQEINRISGRTLLDAEMDDRPDLKPREIATSSAREIASAHTAGMPMVEKEEQDN